MMRDMMSETVLVDRWRSLLSSYNEVACHLERELHDGHGLTMSEFETLDRLIAVDCEKRRMQDLAADMYLSQSALSRTVARLEKSGLVERALCEADRRGVFVAVTDAGVRRHAEARRTHLAILARHLHPETEPAHT
jgi:DNA-binding MarR family transcriptional regulator